MRILLMYYHISKMDLGEKIKLIPKIPASAVFEDLVTERVCFSPTLEGCLVGISGINIFSSMVYEFLQKENPTVYVTNSRSLYKPKRVSDYKLTGEMWSLKPILVHRKGYLCVDSLVKGKIVITHLKENKLSKEFIKGFKSQNFLPRNVI